MQESHFRIIIGLVIIIALYFELNLMMLAITAILSLEAITNYRVPMIVSKLRSGSQQTSASSPNSGCGTSVSHFNIEAERMLRVVLIFTLILSYFMYFDYVWFLPWFVAFALIGAGLSGICPIVLVLKRLGFS